MSDYEGVDPDDIYTNDRGYFTFCYRDGKLLSGVDLTHGELGGKKYGKYRHELMSKRWILGRLGKLDNRKVVSFWNSASQAVEIKKCLLKLLASGKLNGTEVLAFPGIEETTVKAFLAGESTATNRTFPPEILHKLHVSPPAAKKQILRAMGAVVPKRNTPLPGVKYWAPQSECQLNFGEWLMEKRN